MSVGFEEQGQGEVWTPEKFRAELVQATKTHSLPIGRFPQGIDIGAPYFDLGVEMIKRTLADPRKRERSTYGVVNFANKIVIQPEQISDPNTPNSMNTHIDLAQLRVNGNSNYTRTEQLAFNMHTHPKDFPPSPIDLGDLMSDDFGLQAVMIFTPQMAYIVMRTLETPILSHDDAIYKANHWKILLNKRYDQINLVARDESHSFALQAKANWALMRDVSKKYSFATYECMHLRAKVFNRSFT